MIRLILSDLRRKARWFGLEPSARSLLRVALGEGSSAQIIYRLMQWSQRCRLTPLSALFYRMNAHLSHAVIGRRAEFGPGFVILHSYGIVINSDVRAGKNLVIEHGVTIGAEKGRSPVLGDDVFIGAGAKVIGSVQIGSDVKIGANAVVTRSLPDGATAVGIPARVIKIYGESAGPEHPSPRGEAAGAAAVPEGRSRVGE